jgi:hypothetical protein
MCIHLVPRRSALDVGVRWRRRASAQGGGREGVGGGSRKSGVCSCVCVSSGSEMIHVIGLS